MKRMTAWVAVASRIYRILLYAYPKEFRERFGAEMRQVFRDRCRTVFADARPAAVSRFFCTVARDWILSSGKERIANMRTRTARGLGIAALTALIFLFVSTSFLQAFVIPTPSMEGSLLPGDHILVDKRVQAAEIQRGDLVSFRYPEDPRVTFVKRIIGLPGDHIRLVDKQVIRNGRRLVEPYARHEISSTDRYRDNFPAVSTKVVTARGIDMLSHQVVNGEVVVPEGSLFVLGDNRDHSLDSRYWGFVPEQNVIGKPVLVYWSYDAAAGVTRWNRTLLKLGTEPAQ